LKKVLITGSAGFAGIHACRHFLEKGYEVFGMIRNHAHPEIGIREISCDLTDGKEVEKIIGNVKPDMILHLAAQNHSGISWSDPLTTVSTNVMGTLNLLEAVRKKKQEAIILIAGSTLEHDPCRDTIPAHPYGLSKYMQTLAASGWGDLYRLDVRIARSSNMIGPGPSNGICSLFARKCMKENESFHFSNLLDKRDFVDVRDVVIAYEHILVRGTTNHHYVIASGRDRTLLEIARTIKTLTGSGIRITAEQFEKVENGPIDITGIRGLGWRPTIPFEVSLADTIQYIREN
jgi:GDP-4-dehydro-6-deoxy-D-mannose reductase